MSRPLIEEVKIAIAILSIALANTNYLTKAQGVVHDNGGCIGPERKNFCIGDIEDYQAHMSGYDDYVGCTFHYYVSAAPSNIMLFSFTKDGPWSESIEYDITIYNQGYGYGPIYYVKANKYGSTVIKHCSDNIIAVDMNIDAPQYFTVATVKDVMFVQLTTPLYKEEQCQAEIHNKSCYRIYPDKDSPSDNGLKNTLLIKAYTDPGATVYFMALDPDDPSSDEAIIDPTGPEGGDNIDQGPIIKGENFVGIAEATANNEGVATVEMIVSMHPGDNYRVLATCGVRNLAGFRWEPDYINLRDDDGNMLPTEKIQITDLLTVWRRYHVETDGMTAVQGNYASVTIEAISKSRRVITIKPKVLERSRFQKGVLSIEGIGSYVVLDNTSSHITLSEPLPSDIHPIKSKARVYDDDDCYNRGIQDGDSGQNIAVSYWAYIQSELTKIYADAYIVPCFDGIGSEWNSVPFQANIQYDRTIEQFSPVYRQSVNNEKPDYWSVYLQWCYQGDKENDNDPNGEEILALGCSAPNSGYFTESIDAIMPGAEGSCMFLESLKETQQNIAEMCVVACAHEIGHQFSLQEANSNDETESESLMGDKGYRHLSARDLRILRLRINSPGH